MGGFLDGVASAADHLAGSTDEAVGRTFDSEKGGGVVEGTTETLDHAAGSTDEAVARSTDNKKGGGVIDGAADTVADLVIDHKGNPEHDSLDLPGPSANKAAANAADNLTQTLLASPPLAFLALLVVIYVFGQAFDVQLGGGSSG